MGNLQWKQIEGRKVSVFQLGDEPEIIYVIKRRANEYMVVHDDAYTLNSGEVEFFNLKDLELKYGISLE
jgi:hypothetical protein